MFRQFKITNLFTVWDPIFYWLFTHFFRCNASRWLTYVRPSRVFLFGRFFSTIWWDISNLLQCMLWRLCSFAELATPWRKILINLQYHFMTSFVSFSFRIWNVLEIKHSSLKSKHIWSNKQNTWDLEYFWFYLLWRFESYSYDYALASNRVFLA